MVEYIIKVELLSDTIFGSGQSISGIVDQDVLHDKFGFPYMKGKTIKGKIREEFTHVLKCIGKGNTDMDIVVRFFGKPDGKSISGLLFSDLEISKNIRDILAETIKENQSELDSNDVLNAATSIRTFTSIDYNSGVAKTGSLRKMRVINNGLTFYSYMTSITDLSETEEGIIGSSVASLKHLGTMETRGKGYVKCSLLKDGIDITRECVDRLEEGISDEISKV